VVRKVLPVIQEMEVHVSGATMALSDTYYPFHKNGFLDVYKDAQDQSQRIFLTKRPGINANTTTINPSPSPAAGSIAVCGSLAPDGSKNFFIAYTTGTLVGTTFYYNNGLKATPGAWAISGATGAPGAHDIVALASTSTASSYGGYFWAMTSFNTGAVIDNTGAITQIVDADYTAWTKKSNILPMDGYLFQADTDSSYIYNSDLNTPTSWTATGRILASNYPGTIVRLMRVRNFLVAFKTASLEFFSNAGNPTPGSPLSAEPQLTQKYGCSSPQLITEVSDGIVFAGFDPAGRAGIFKIHYNTLTVSEIGNSFLSSVLQNVAATGATFQISDGRPTSYFRSLVLPFRDKELITFPLSLFGANATFIYDNKLNSWCMWTAYNNFTAAEDAFPSYMILRRSPSTGGPDVLLADISTFTFSRFNANETADYSTHAIDFKWVSSYMDFGTSRRKFMGSLTVALENNAPASLATVITFLYRDGDTSGTTGTRSATWSSTAAGANKKIIFRRLGSFVSRQFVIGSNDTVSSVRIGAVEVDLDMEEDDIS
jgi:hypothetical protein